MKKMILHYSFIICILVIPAIAAWGEQQPIQIQKAPEKPLDSSKEIKAPSVAEIEKNLVEVVFLIEKANLDNLEKEKRIVEYQEKLYRSQVDWVRRNLSYDVTDFNDRLKTYESQKTARLSNSSSVTNPFR